MARSFYVKERLIYSFLYFRNQNVLYNFSYSFILNFFENKSYASCKSVSMFLKEYLCLHFSAKQSKMYQAIDGSGYSEE